MGKKILKKYIIRPVRNRLLYCAVNILCMERFVFPRKLALWWHGLLAKMVYPFFVKMHKIIIANLTLGYGDSMSEKEKYEIGKRIIVNLTKTFTDYAWWSKKKTRAEFLQYFTVEGEEHLKAAYDRGKGVLCLIPHTCGWEFSAILPPILGYETSAVSSKIKNPALNRFMIEKRESRGMKNFSRQDHCYDKLIEALKNGDCMIIMIDQDSLNIRGEFLDFFGHPAYTPLGCARMAMDSGAAIVPMATIRKDDDSYLFKILPEVSLELTGDKEYDIKHNTQIHNNIIESIVREYPDQWIWMHKRWSTTPEKLAVHLEKRRKRKEQEALLKQQQEQAK